MDEKELEKIFKASGMLKVNNNIKNDIVKIIEWQNLLREVNINGVEPLYNTIGDENVLYQQDCSNDKCEKEDIFENAPEKENNFFLVPKVINRK